MTSDNDIQATVLSAMRLLYDPKILPMLKQGLESKAPWPTKLAFQVVGLLKMLDDKLPNGVPPKAVGPAAQLLLADMIVFISQIGGPKLERSVVQQALPLMKKLLLEVFGKHSKGAKGAKAAPKEITPEEAQQRLGGAQPQQAAPQQPPAQPGLIQMGA